MTRIMALALLLLCATEARAQPARDQATIGWAVQELARLEGMAASCTLRREMVRSLRRIRRKLNRIQRVTPPPPPAHTFTPAPPPPPPRAAMSGARFNHFIGQVRAQAIDRGKLAVISTGSAANFFYARQVVTLLNSLATGRNRLKALQFLAPRVLDHQNVYTLVGAFYTGRDKKKAQRIIQRIRY